MFEGQSHLRATFRDVSGLKVGSPVRMGGVDVGHVTEINFGATTADRGIHVRFSLVSRQLNRVRSDSVEPPTFQEMSSSSSSTRDSSPLIHSAVASQTSHDKVRSMTRAMPAAGKAACSTLAPKRIAESDTSSGSHSAAMRSP